MEVILILVIVALCFIILGYINSGSAPTRTVNAKVVGKHRQEIFSKYGALGNKYRYVVTFRTEENELSFDVSEFSYGGYRVGERGKLTYKGSRLLDFH